TNGSNHHIQSMSESEVLTHSLIRRADRPIVTSPKSQFDLLIRYAYIFGRNYLKSVQIKLESTQPLGHGEAFGVRRSSAAFPALQFANDSLVSSYTFSDPKAGKAALDRRTPKASPFRDISLFSIGFYLHIPQSRNPVICAV